MYFKSFILNSWSKRSGEGRSHNDVILPTYNGEPVDGLRYGCEP